MPRSRTVNGRAEVTSPIRSNSRLSAPGWYAHSRETFITKPICSMSSSNRLFAASLTSARRRNCAAWVASPSLVVTESPYFVPGPRAVAWSGAELACAPGIPRRRFRRAAAILPADEREWRREIHGPTTPALIDHRPVQSAGSLPGQVSSCAEGRLLPGHGASSPNPLERARWPIHRPHSLRPACAEPFERMSAQAYRPLTAASLGACHAYSTPGGLAILSIGEGHFDQQPAFLPWAGGDAGAVSLGAGAAQPSTRPSQSRHAGCTVAGLPGPGQPAPGEAGPLPSGQLPGTCRWQPPPAPRTYLDAVSLRT